MRICKTINDIKLGVKYSQKSILIFTILGGGNASNGNWRGGAGPGNQTKMTFMISSSDVGRLIGSGGSRIKELRQASGCRVGTFFWIMYIY